MEGRDIASVVFADAPVKLYLQARPDLRAERRAAERAGDVERSRRRSRERDVATPRTTPHEPAPGATVIDTSELDPRRRSRPPSPSCGERAPELLP